MVKNDNLSKLTQQLCELRLEERRVRSDIRHLVARNATIDFAKAKQLNIMRNGVKKKIESIESKIMPKIIAWFWVAGLKNGCNCRLDMVRNTQFLRDNQIIV